MVESIRKKAPAKSKKHSDCIDENTKGTIKGQLLSKDAEASVRKIKASTEAQS